MRRIFQSLEPRDAIVPIALTLIFPGACMVATLAGCEWAIIQHVGLFMLGAK